MKGKKIIIGMTAAAICFSLVGCKAKKPAENADVRMLSAQLNLLQRHVSRVDVLDESSLVVSTLAPSSSDSGTSYKISDGRTSGRYNNSRYSARSNYDRRNNKNTDGLSEDASADMGTAGNSSALKLNRNNVNYNRQGRSGHAEGEGVQNLRFDMDSQGNQQSRTNSSSGENAETSNLNNYISRVNRAYSAGNEVLNKRKSFISKRSNLSSEIKNTKDLINSYNKGEVDLSHEDALAIREYSAIIRETTDAFKLATPRYNKTLKAAKKFNMNNVEALNAKYLALNTKMSSANAMLETAEKAVKSINNILSNKAEDENNFNEDTTTRAGNSSRGMTSPSSALNERHTRMNQFNNTDLNDSANSNSTGRIRSNYSSSAQNQGNNNATNNLSNMGGNYNNTNVNNTGNSSMINPLSTTAQNQGSLNSSPNFNRTSGSAAANENSDTFNTNGSYGNARVNAPVRTQNLPQRFNRSPRSNTVINRQAAEANNANMPMSNSSMGNTGRFNTETGSASTVANSYNNSSAAGNTSLGVVNSGSNVNTTGMPANYQGATSGLGTRANTYSTGMNRQNNYGRTTNTTGTNSALRGSNMNTSDTNKLNTSNVNNTTASSNGDVNSASSTEGAVSLAGNATSSITGSSAAYSTAGSAGTVNNGASNIAAAR